MFGEILLRQHLANAAQGHAGQFGRGGAIGAIGVDDVLHFLDRPGIVVTLFRQLAIEESQHLLVVNFFAEFLQLHSRDFGVDHFQGNGHGGLSENLAAARIGLLLEGLRQFQTGILDATPFAERPAIPQQDRCVRGEMGAKHIVLLEDRRRRRQPIEHVGEFDRRRFRAFPPFIQRRRRGDRLGRLLGQQQHADALL